MRKLAFAGSGAMSAAAMLAVGCATQRAVLPLTHESVRIDSLDASVAHAAPPVARTVTGARIARARSEPQNWLTYYGAYDGQRFSVWALDAATGRRLWQYQYALPIDLPLCCGNVSRGVAVAEGRVIFAAQNGMLIALDAERGTPVWQVQFVDPRAGESATLAPLVVKNMVLVGNSGAEYGVRGHIDAFDLTTGRRVWRRYTVPKPGEPGADSWPADNGGRGGGAWARGGGTAWITGTYDPELDLVYWGTGNPSPVFSGEERAGSNLYTSAVVALDPDDGTIRWHYQWTPHDVWDCDGIGESILFDQDGRKLLAHFDRNGYLFILDRTNGRFVRSARYARADWGMIDPATGALSARREPSASGTHICPGPAGAKVWNHASYSPRTGLLYVPVIELCATFRSEREEFKEGIPYLGSSFQNTDEREAGAVKALDPRTGREVWAWMSPSPIVTSMLSTAGDVVFTGEPSGMFDAFDARTGELLWQYQTGAGIHGNPVTYAVGARQYVAIPVGWGGWLEGFAPKNYGAPRATELVVFALP